MYMQFQKDWDPKHGFTRTEALIKQAEIDDEYRVREPDSQWAPAKIVFDKDKISGFKVVITTKE